jgi:aryl-alcohol dehydrogenase-like predicted oxidoreductase
MDCFVAALLAMTDLEPNERGFQMQKRKLGGSSLSIAPLVFGCNVFGWTADEKTSLSLIDAFLAHGFDCLDTADMYSIWVPGHVGGESETVIGTWLARGGARDKVVIATKVGADMQAGGKGLSRAHITKSVEQSLKRLNTDYIDLYQSHRDDPDTPMDEVLATYDGLIRAGKVRAIGASNFTAPRLAEALATSAAKGLPRYTCLQPHYNLAHRSDFEGDLEALCVKESIGVIPYYSLAAGFLSGKYRSKAEMQGRARSAAIGHYANERGFGLLKVLDAVAETHKATPVQVALAWLMAKPAVTAPIVSATSVKQLEEILKSVAVKLDADSMAALDKAGA